ncbi:ABC transporter permease [Cumulibacter soli]|uniref:ABC transporter permease n=1 Tax=Cumulibacter soli TaxID=2546344 RepID=UPI001ABBD1C9|nr:ABC transporter permease [Cumulibacter soli]
MTEDTKAATLEPVVEPSSRRVRRPWLGAFRDPMTLGCSVFVVLVVFAAVFAPWVSRGIDPATQDLTAIMQGPSGAHWLGTDDLGRDLWARVVYGARISLFAALISSAVAAAIGIPLGIVAGYFGGWVDAVLMRVVDTILSFPALVLAVGVGAALGPGLTNAMIAIGIVFSPVLARLARGQVLAVKERLFVTVAFTYGTSSARVIRRHIIPNVLRPLIVQTALMMGTALLAEASLSFLGLGVQAPTPSWGSMLQSAFQFIGQRPEMIYIPGLAIGLTVLSFNSLGDALQDILDPDQNTTGRRRKFRRVSRTATQINETR